MENRDEILLLLGEIKGQITGFFASQAAQDRRLDKHDERISVLEKAKMFERGVAAAVGAGASALVTFLMKVM